MAKKSVPSITFADVIEGTKEAKAFVAQIEGFRFPDTIQNQLLGAAAIHASGVNSQQAIAEGVAAINGLYTIVAAFFRNAIPRRYEARYDRMTQEDYDVHILQLVYSSMSRLQEAVQTETGKREPKDFTVRLEAYIEVCKVFSEAPEAQQKYLANQSRKQNEERRAEAEALVAIFS
jgi:hypothetical protein